jgi:hypothetical protein
VVYVQRKGLSKWAFERFLHSVALIWKCSLKLFANEEEVAKPQSMAISVTGGFGLDQQHISRFLQSQPPDKLVGRLSHGFFKDTVKMKFRKTCYLGKLIDRRGGIWSLLERISRIFPSGSKLVK